jgi:hypothetical protein
MRRKTLWHRGENHCCGALFAGGGGEGGGAVSRVSCVACCVQPVAWRHVVAAPHPSSCTTLRRLCAARHGSSVASHTWDGRNLDVACQPLHAACCMVHGACCMLHVACCRSQVDSCCHLMRSLEGVMHASKSSRLFGMALAHEKVGWKIRWSRLPVYIMYSSCTASIAAEQCRLAAHADRGRRQCCREVAAGGRDREVRGRLVHRSSVSLQGAPSRIHGHS